MWFLNVRTVKADQIGFRMAGSAIVGSVTRNPQFLTHHLDCGIMRSERRTARVAEVSVIKWRCWSPLNDFVTVQLTAQQWNWNKTVAKQFRNSFETVQFHFVVL